MIKESKKSLKRSKKNAEGKLTPQGHRSFLQLQHVS